MAEERNMGTKHRTREAHVSEPGVTYRALLIALVFAGLITATLGAQPAQAQQNTGETDEQQTAELDYKAAEIEMVGLINDYREQEGLEPLLVSDTASLAAKRHSEDMARYGFMDHDTQQSAYFEPGATFDERMDQSGYDHETARSENIAAGAGVEETFEGWRESPEHDKNMLDPEMEVIGIGMSHASASEGSEGSDGSTEDGYDTYWTTDFGAHADETATEVSEIEAAPDGGDAGTGEQPESEQQDETATGDQYEQESGDDPGEDSSTGEDDTTTRSTDDEDGASEDQYSSGDEDSSDDDPSGGSGEDTSTGEDGDSGEQTSEDPDSGEDGEDGEKGQNTAGNSGDGDCDTLAGFEKSPFDEDFGSELTRRIKEKVDCKLDNAGGGGEDGEDGSVSSDSTEMEGEQITNQTTIVEESSGESETGGDSSDSSSDSSGENGASVLGPTSGGSGQSEDSGREN